jgi:hypothetical protein
VTNKPCRNCAGADIYSQEVSACGAEGPNLLPLGFFVSKRFHLRVCGSCGLVQWFVPPDLLGKVKKTFRLESGESPDSAG